MTWAMVYTIACHIAMFAVYYIGRRPCTRNTFQ